MPTFNLVDGNGDSYSMEFASNEKVIAFAERSVEQFTRPQDHVTAVYTFDNHLVWSA
jgi:hypothetical protein